MLTRAWWAGYEACQRDVLDSLATRSTAESPGVSTATDNPGPLPPNVFRFRLNSRSELPR